MGLHLVTVTSVALSLFSAINAEAFTYYSNPQLDIRPKETTYSARVWRTSENYPHLHKFQGGDLTISQATIRATPPNAPVSGGYMKIENNGNKPDRLLGGSVSFARKVEVHEMKMDNEVMRMRAIQGGLIIPPGQEVILERGGLHLMFMKLNQRMEAGDAHPVTLKFERAGEVEVEFIVVPLGGHAGHHRDHAVHDRSGR